MMQSVVVVLIVTWAAWTASWKLAPSALRRTLVARMAGLLRRLGLRGVAERLSVAKPDGPACGSVCGGCSPASVRQAQPLVFHRKRKEP